VSADRSHNWFVRAAAVIGDRSNPFYREERQRDVWNEASAVAFQVLIWLHLSAATAALWFIGEDAVPYVYAPVAMIGLASWIAMLYAWSLGVDVPGTSRVQARLMVPIAVLVVLLAAGLIRATSGGGAFDDWSTVAGAVTGAGMALAVFAVGSWYTKRRLRTRDED